MDIVELTSIEPFNWHAIGAGVAAGLIIGLERQLRGKPVGIRTSTLIVIGTYIFIEASKVISTDSVDSTRIIGQVVTGIGFLGAGVMLARDGTVSGVTSAATIWALASIGVCIGIEQYFVAVKLSLVVVSILIGVDILEDYFQSLTQGVHHRYRNWRGQ